MTVGTHCCTSSLTSSKHVDENLIQRFKIWIDPSIRLVVITFPCVIWHTAAISPHFPSSLPSFHYGHFRWGFGEWWINWSTRCIFQIPFQVFIRFLFLKDMTVDSFLALPLLILSFTSPVSSVFFRTYKMPYQDISEFQLIALQKWSCLCKITVWFLPNCVVFCFFHRFN